ncbi:BTAD domain-containing putative transcriptional regulator [Streptomyces sp. B1866]|uniref:AfsR/SARP family transcriptional regulator n=1 Tax=Streptomyces sp. B1866 TaxID=3075431 RepID=UPI00289249B5|nr:BTAD domain-containing putative transcriptional regulator [Streptomyces sp. B1866]MDT3399680.1 BTAD domain-containing putative transcriptional regulator [Streptomyces sp. B1866]
MGAIPLQFGLLGPIEASHGGTAVAVGTPQCRTVLAVLLLASRQAVTVATLRERIWPGSPPASAVRAIHVYVHRLRQLLGQFPDDGTGDLPRLVTHSGHSSDHVSYVLHVAPEAVDVTRCRRLLEEGETAGAAGDPQTALTRYEAALALWRGEPLAGLALSDYLRSACAGLAEMRLDLRKHRAAALLALGAASRAADELHDLHALHRDDETVVVQLARALHAAGAQTRAVRLLTDELARWKRQYGLEPDPLIRQRDSLVRGGEPAR